MKVYFIEVKGADFSLINNPTKKGATFNASFLEGIDQIIRRKQYSLANELSYRDEAHRIRTIVASGTQMYNSLLCAKGPLLVDKGKPVSVRGVVIGGRSIQGLNQIEAEKRDAWRKSIDFHIELMSWDSFLTSVR
ncbi:Shedu anti-phage system protein SduA domain-containing protein [Paenibacillus sp. FSL L8-0435]|uniref:Shedu anti-phage system protein SduA domain-containing protein n=1 Tax=Paenibacillus sp. FSL L8-0435 TaxID=2954618 RepID=UPI0030DB28CF